MKQYIVDKRAVYILSAHVEAESEEEAIKLAKEGAGEEVYCEFSYYLSSDKGSVEEVEEN